MPFPPTSPVELTHKAAIFFHVLSEAEAIILPEIAALSDFWIKVHSPLTATFQTARVSCSSEQIEEERGLPSSEALALGMTELPVTLNGSGSHPLYLT